MFRRTPFVRQLHALECGAASLAMVLGHHGRWVGLDELREVTGVNRDGVSAGALVRASRLYGLQPSGVRVEVDQLAELPTPAILHWQMSHFLVMRRVRRGGVDILDPAQGSRRVSWDEVRRNFSGVALVFEAGPDLVRSHRPGGWAVLRHVLSIAREGGLLRIATLSAALIVLGLLVPVLTGVVVDRVLAGNDPGLLPGLGIVVVGGITLHAFAALVRNTLLAHAQARLDYALTRRFVHHLVSLPFRFFMARTSGELMVRADANARLRELVTTQVTSAGVDGVLVASYLALLLVWAPQLAAVTVVLSGLQLMVFAAAARRVREVHTQRLDRGAEAQSVLIQLLLGMRALKAAGTEGLVMGRWVNLLTNELNADVRIDRLSVHVNAASGALSGLAPLTLLLLGAAQVVDGALTLGQMLAANALALAVLAPLARLVPALVQLRAADAYVERIDDVLAAEPERQSGVVPSSARLRGAIRAEGIEVRHGPLAAPVLQGLSFVVEPGAMVAVVGRSGAGKSTLVSLLTGLVDPSAGALHFDGLDASTLDLRWLRGRIGVVTQRPFISAASVRDNIMLGDPQASFDAVREAAIHARIHDDIVALPRGYDTVLQEGGTSLSGGQAQRLVLARALVRKPDILVLDEATSALDTLTEQAIATALQGLACTRVVVAHRLSTVRHADEILVLDRGSLVERGSYDDLLARGGAFASLVAAQLQGTG